MDRPKEHIKLSSALIATLSDTVTTFSKLQTLDKEKVL